MLRLHNQQAEHHPSRYYRSITHDPEEPMTATDTVLIDAAQKELAYRGLGRQYVEQGNAWLALHAFATADLYAALHLFHTHGMDTARFLTDVASAFDGIADRFVDGMDPFMALITFRTRVILSVPEDIRPAYHRAIGSARLFGDLETISTDATEAMVTDHLGGRTVMEFIDWAYTESFRLSAAAARKRAAGDEWGAVVDTYAADLSSFEAWLFERSLVVGDSTFAQAEMRWALAVSALETITALPENAADAAFVVRARLAWALGPAEAAAFADRLDQRLV